jgi:hypothetical protein
LTVRGVGYKFDPGESTEETGQTGETGPQGGTG